MLCQALMRTQFQPSNNQICVSSPKCVIWNVDASGRSNDAHNSPVQSERGCLQTLQFSLHASVSADGLQSAATEFSSVMGSLNGDTIPGSRLWRSSIYDCHSGHQMISQCHTVHRRRNQTSTLMYSSNWGGMAEVPKVCDALPKLSRWRRLWKCSEHEVLPRTVNLNPPLPMSCTVSK